MAESQQRSRVAIVADSLAGQRFADRLGRAGIRADIVAPTTLTGQAEAGQLFLAPLSAGALAETAVQHGAHVCLLPPWPVGTVTLDGVVVGASEVAQRGLAVSAPALDIPGAVSAKQQAYKILYRECLVGAIGVTLVESEAGEPLLVGLQRKSNLHGYLLVTTLQLSITSAQTRVDDVARLIERLLTWLTLHAEPVSHETPVREEQSEHTREAEANAPIVALALMLSTTHGDEHASADIIQLEAARSAFDRVCQSLAQAADPALFDAGWGWLAAHGVLWPQADESARIEREALDHYSALWQLGPRLRRLHGDAGLSM